MVPSGSAISIIASAVAGGSRRLESKHKWGRTDFGRLIYARADSQTTLPRIPGRDYASVVEAGPAEWIGAEVRGTGGDTGFTRDGTRAELIAVPVMSLRRKPGPLSFDAAASAGVNYLAAWCALVEAAGLFDLVGGASNFFRSRYCRDQSDRHTLTSDQEAAERRS